MPGKFRRVKDKLSKRRKDSVVDSTRTKSYESEISAEASLLGLPAELRNQIYLHLASATTLVLSPGSPKKRPTPVGLLLACKQTWEEYRAILLSQAALTIIVSNYNFNIVVRTFEKLNDIDMSLVKLNPQLWIYLQLAHVPGRDDRRALKGWIDYRSDAVPGPYFGSGSHRLPDDLSFQYDVTFASQIRPPRPISRYNNGYQMKFDLVRAHLRMTNNLQPRDEAPSVELRKIANDLDECAAIYERRSTEQSQAMSPGQRTNSVVAQQALQDADQATVAQPV